MSPTSVVGHQEGHGRRIELAQRASNRLATSLDDVLGDEFRLRAGAKPDYRVDGVLVGLHVLAERCPRRAVWPADDYQDSVTTTRRRIGLLVLRSLDEHRPVGASPTTAAVAPMVEHVLSDGSDWPSGPWQWVQGLDRAGRAAVAASVTTWCVSLLHLVRGHPGIGWADPVRPPRRNVDGRAVALSASYEAQMGSPRTGIRLLSVSDAVSDSLQRVRAGHIALVQTLSAGVAPARITVGSPAAGTLDRVEVDDVLLDLAVDRVVEHVAHHRRRDHAPVIVGPGCAHCHLLDSCPDGTSHLERVERAQPSTGEPTT